MKEIKKNINILDIISFYTTAINNLIRENTRLRCQLEQRDNQIINLENELDDLRDKVSESEY